MRNIQIILTCAACLFFVSLAVTAQKAKNTMTNADVVEMVKAGLPESTIVLAIQQSDPNFDTSVKGLIELSKQGVSQKIMDAILQPQTTPTKSETPKRTDPGNAIAWKDIGSLRVVLKSILPIKLDYRRIGMRCGFEFVNLETQKPIVVAMNAIQAYNTATIGQSLRSTLVDENGLLWSLNNTDVTGGMSKIGVGYQPITRVGYDPADIVTVLSKRDDLRSDVSNENIPFIFGSMTEMSPGQNITVTMTFAQDNNQANSGNSSKVFQMATEIVVGSLTTGSKKSYTLYNVTFDRVSPK